MFARSTTTRSADVTVLGPINAIAAIDAVAPSPAEKSIVAVTAIEPIIVNKPGKDVVARISSVVVKRRSVEVFDAIVAISGSVVRIDAAVLKISQHTGRRVAVLRAVNTFTAEKVIRSTATERMSFPSPP